jgi:hypothetical protein
MDPITPRQVETIKKITEDTITTTPSSTPPGSLPPINSKILAPGWLKDQANTGRLLKLQDKITDPTGLQNAMDDYVISAQDAVDKQAESAPKPMPVPQPTPPIKPNPVPVPPPPSPFA